MKMHNSRAGHAPNFGVEIIYFMFGLVIGWPVALPFLFITGYLSETFGWFKMDSPVLRVLFYLSVIVGAYVHFKMWWWLFLTVKTWLF